MHSFGLFEMGLMRVRFNGGSLVTRRALASMLQRCGFASNSGFDVIGRFWANLSDLVRWGRRCGIGSWCESYVIGTCLDV